MAPRSLTVAVDVANADAVRTVLAAVASACRSTGDPAAVVAEIRLRLHALGYDSSERDEPTLG